MPRPCCGRRVEGKPVWPVFKPAGIPMRELDEIVMTLDEFEAVRLADLEGMYQEQAAGRMGVSRPTFSRIVDSAHRKIADAIVNGRALKIEGGPVLERSRYRCGNCHAEWEGGAECPRCGATRDAMITAPGAPGRCGLRMRRGCGKPFRGAAPGKGESE